MTKAKAQSINVVSSAQVLSAAVGAINAEGTLVSLAVKVATGIHKRNPINPDAEGLLKLLNGQVRSFFSVEIGRKAADGDVPGLDNAMRRLSAALVILTAGDKVSPNVTFDEFVTKAKDARTALGIGRKVAPKGPAGKGAPDQSALTGEPVTATVSEAADYYASLRESTEEVRTQVATWLLRHMSNDARTALLLSLQSTPDGKPKGKRAPRQPAAQ